MGAREGSTSPIPGGEFVTDSYWVDTDNVPTGVVAEMPGSYQPMTRSRVREDGSPPNPGQDIYSGLGYDGADALRIGAGFDLAQKNRGIIGRRWEGGWPVVNGIEKGVGGHRLPHLDLSVGVGRVNPTGVSAEEGASIPAVYVSNPAIG